MGGEAMGGEVRGARREKGKHRSRLRRGVGLERVEQISEEHVPRVRHEAGRRGDERPVDAH